MIFVSSLRKDSLLKLQIHGTCKLFLRNLTVKHTEEDRSIKEIETIRSLLWRRQSDAIHAIRFWRSLTCQPIPKLGTHKNDPPDGPTARQFE